MIDFQFGFDHFGHKINVIIPINLMKCGKRKTAHIKKVKKKYK